MTSEFARAKTTLREGKSAGPDGIPPEVLKNCGLNNIILQFCNLALLSNKQPDMWSLSNIIPVPKAGDLSKPDNYRGISLTFRTAYQPTAGSEARPDLLSDHVLSSRTWRMLNVDLVSRSHALLLMSKVKCDITSSVVMWVTLVLLVSTSQVN
ncbi:hypothetical protein AAFF_G00350410 [Aldrovandia affinis]|uniref:Uncharacterized protein n=1 Tax=Aldrovandia affinis TaxID=143900 RepID=A0AAD7VZE6_9TELE|nr:hypothetical protein AAFF_G00350410 [Aldrovandia affinis]